MQLMQLDIPSLRLPENNVFNLRQNEWNNQIVETTLQMLSCCEEYGIVCKEISMENVKKWDMNELKKTSSRQLKVVLTQPNGKDLELNYDIPWLVNNHFYVGGNRKVTLFQIFDMPVIEKDKMIKIRTNIQIFSLMLRNNTKSYNYYLSLFGREVPFCYVMYAYVTKDQIKEKFLIDENGEFLFDPKRYPKKFLLFLEDMSLLIKDENENKSRLLAKFFNRKTDESIIENIMLVSKIDIFSRRFMRCANILDEFIYTLCFGTTDDRSYDNKRIRFLEQVVYSHLCKDIYNMITVLKDNKKGRFCNNSKAIISAVNVSPICQHDYSLNPLAQISLLTRTSVCGTGGFEKENVPSYLRDIHPSMFGRIDPADTGDRENCGTIQYLVPTIQMGKNLEFGEPVKDITGIAVSHVPFLEHDDQTRLQMASSQQRHAIMLKNFDIPLIQSGIEGMYTDHSTFIFRAKQDGTVVYLNKEMIVVQYKNKTCEAYNIGIKKLYISVCDFYHVYVKNVGDKFKAGDVLAESNFLKSGRTCLGRNLNTAIMIFRGYNYEDGIVISDRLVRDNVFTSVHYLDLSFEIPANKVLLNLTDDYQNYLPIPKVGQRIKKGEPYAKIKTIQHSGGQLDSVFDACSERTMPEDAIITDVRIYANTWNKSFPQYDQYIQSLIKSGNDSKQDIINVLSRFLTQDELQTFLESVDADQTEKSNKTFKVKGDSIDGLMIEITAVYFRPIQVGDKIGNRHGNKGVISAIIPEELMPRFSNGQHADVVINPLGIITRMNLGQLYECHLSHALKNLKAECVRRYKETDQNRNRVYTDQEIKDYIMGFIRITDKTSDGYYQRQVEEYLNNVEMSQFITNIDTFYIIQPPFESVQWEDLDLAMKYTGSQYEYGCYDPYEDYENGKQTNEFHVNIQNSICFGSMYFMKLNHIAKDKVAARGVGPYSTKTCQPLDGKSRKGGQRLGEMEVWALASHGATINLEECLKMKSDSIRLRNGYLSDKMQNTDLLLDTDEDSVSQSVRLFQSELRTIGLDYYIEEE